jgi:hypothetical protein
MSTACREVLIEPTIPGPERLSKTDVGVTAWPKFAGTHARWPPEERMRELDVA